MKIKKMYTKYNHDVGHKRPKKYIVIHWVGSASSAYNNAKYFQGGDRQASAHFFVDDKDIIKSVKEKDIAWAVGSSGWLDQGSPYAKYGHKYWNKCTNTNSISIELCCYKSSKGNLCISKKTLENARWLVKYLMKKYDINSAHVIRHFDVNGKICPGPYIQDSKWKSVKSYLTK